MSDIVGRRLAQLADLPVTELKGVTPKRAEALASLGIRTVLDVLTNYPRRYVDRTNQVAIGDVVLGEEVVLLATVTSGRLVRARNGREFVVINVADGTGNLDITFFNQKWRLKHLPVGTAVALFGKVEMFKGRRGMTNPFVDRVGTRVGRIVPIYPQSDKARIDSDTIADLCAETLRRSGEFAEPLEESILDRLDLVDRTTAFPPSTSRRMVTRSVRRDLGWCSMSCFVSRSNWCAASASSNGPRSESRTSRVTVVDRWFDGSTTPCPTSSPLLRYARSVRSSRT